MLRWVAVLQKEQECGKGFFMAGMAIASKIISVVSAAAQAANSYQNYQAQAQGASANAQVAESNARNVAVQGNYAQDAKLREGKQFISRQYVGNLQSGAGGAGTTGDRAVAKSVYNLENDLNLLSYNFQTKSIDFLNQAKMYKYEKRVAKANAANSLIGGGLGVANSIFSSKSFDRNSVSGTSTGGANAAVSPLNNNVPTRISYFYE